LRSRSRRGGACSPSNAAVTIRFTACCPPAGRRRSRPTSPSRSSMEPPAR
jgi:hypothetical protein